MLTLGILEGLWNGRGERRKGGGGKTRYIIWRNIFASTNVGDSCNVCVPDTSASEQTLWKYTVCWHYYTSKIMLNYKIYNNKFYLEVTTYKYIQIDIYKFAWIFILQLFFIMDLDNFIWILCRSKLYRWIWRSKILKTSEI